MQDNGSRCSFSNSIHLIRTRQMVISREDLFLKSHLHRIPASSSCFLPPSVFGSFKSSTRSKTVFSKFQLLSFLPLNCSVVNSTNCSDKISNGKLHDTYDATMPIDDEFAKEHSVARASKFRFILTIIKWTL